MLALLAFVILLQVVDIVTTLVILDRGGRELNPVLAWLFNRLGAVPVLVAIKTAFCGLLLWLYVTGVDGLVYALGLLGALYVAVIVNNLRVLRRI
jgi:hypothetical protein